MVRRIFTIASAASLVLFVLTAVLWVRSYWVADVFYGHSGQWSTATGSSRGAIYRSAIGPMPAKARPPPAAVASGYTRMPAFPVHVGQRFPGDPGIHHQGGLMGFLWFVSDGGTGSKPAPPDKYLPRGASYGIPTFAPCRAYVAPYWSLTLLFALLPATWLVSHVRCWRRQRLRGGARCVRCGYDLRATPDRCPECGHVPEKVTA